MAQPLPNVMPGDLITAGQMNTILQAISSLNDRVTVLEGSAIGGSAVVITDLVPPTGTVQVGTELRVLGRNFGVSIGATVIYIDDTRISALKFGSTDTLLIFDVPVSLTVPQSGRSALLTVNNSNSSAQRTLTLLPSLTLGGGVDVIPQGTTPATPAAGSPFTFQFKLNSRASLDATYAINVLVNVAGDQPAWQSSVQILDQNQNLVTQLPLAAGQQATFFVRINPIPPGTNGTQFIIEVTATAGGLNGSSGKLTNTVGTAATQPDTTINMVPTSPVVHGTGNITASQIQLSQGAIGKLTLLASFTVVGVYNISSALGQGAANWNVSFINPAPPAGGTPQFTVTSQDLQSGGTKQVTQDVTVAPQPGATGGAITFQAQRQGQSQSFTFSMALIAS